MMTDQVRVVWRTGKTVILRPPVEADLPFFQQWINDPENNCYLMRTGPTSEAEQQKWYTTVTSGDCDRIVLSVCLLDGTLIGNTALNINTHNQSGVTGTLIGSKLHQGQGHGTDAKMLVLEYAFNWLGLRKVTSKILDFNDRSKRYAEKCGYRFMARIEQECFRNGRWVDEVQYVVFREAWLPLWEQYQKDFAEH